MDTGVFGKLAHHRLPDGFCLCPFLGVGLGHIQSEGLVQGRQALVAFLHIFEHGGLGQVEQLLPVVFRKFTQGRG